MKLLLVVGMTAGLLLLLGMGQHRLIYFPRSYNAPAPDGVTALRYMTGAGKQVAYFLPPRVAVDGGAPRRLWVVFGGNASLALDWYSFASRFPDDHAGFLLVDYPGFGACEGTPSPETILASTQGAVESLADHLGLPVDKVREHVSLLGHSLGAAAALQYGVGHPARDLVLIAPFTSLRDMARRVVGWPLNHLAIQRFDNRAWLHAVMGKISAPRVVILHGDRDEVVPVRMGRELAGMFPGRVRYVELAGGDHNGIISTAELEIVRAMLGTQPVSQTIGQ